MLLAHYHPHRDWEVPLTGETDSGPHDMSRSMARNYTEEQETDLKILDYSSGKSSS